MQVRRPGLATAVFMLLGLAWPAGRADPSPPAACSEFERILAAVERGASDLELARIAAELARSADAVACFLETGVATRDQEPERLSDEQRSVLARTARLLDKDAVVAHVTAEANQEPDAGWRRAALELLRWHAEAAQLPLLARLAAGEEDSPPAEDSLGDVFQAAVVDLVRRDPRAFDELPRAAGEFEALRGRLIRAVGAAADPAGLEWLAIQLDRAGMTGLALQQIRRVAPRASLAELTAVAEAVRPCLRSEDPAQRVHAARALGAIGDPEAVAELISMLEEDGRGDRGAACAALRELSGRKLPERVEAWRRWHEEELRWLRDESAAALDQLSSANDAEVVAAVRTLSARSLRRDHWATQLARLLATHGSAVVRGQVCLGLARLGSRVVAEDLVLALGDPEPSVRSAASTALRRVTGLSLPPDPDVWSEALLSTR